MKQVIEVRHLIRDTSSADAQQAAGFSDEEVWLNAWLTVAGALDCKESKTATVWADNALTEFKKRFPK